MSRILFQIAASLLLGTIVVGSAGATHVLPVAATPAPAAGCHHGEVPINPVPADYRCCIRGHRTALLNRAFPERPALIAVKLSDASLAPADASESNPVPSDSVPSGGPPLVLILRI